MPRAARIAPRLVTLAIGPALVGLGACGGGVKDAQPAPRADKTEPRSLPRDSKDGERDSQGHDDVAVLDYGRPADEATRRAIVALVRRYYTAAADGDGTKACSMLAPVVGETVPEEYEEPPGHRNGTCAAVASRLFRAQHRRLAIDRDSLTVTRVRVQERKALAVLRFAWTTEPRKISTRREAGVWKLKDLLDKGMP